MQLGFETETRDLQSGVSRTYFRVLQNGENRSRTFSFSSSDPHTCVPGQAILASLVSLCQWLGLGLMGRDDLEEIVCYLSIYPLPPLSRPTFSFPFTSSPMYIEGRLSQPQLLVGLTQSAHSIPRLRPFCSGMGI